MRILRIRKRDGREVPYDRSKIEGAVAGAEAAVGERRAGFAGEVASLVELLLERRFGDPRKAVPGIEEIQDLVERALVEMGAASVAKAYILYREKRAQARAAMIVREDGAAADRPSSHSLRVQSKDGAPAWSKGRIAAALMGETDLSRERAEEVASRVESRVFASGLRSISTALIRELVDNELVELGLESALRRHRPIGIPRHDLRRLLFEPAPAHPLEDRVGGEILARFALEDLLPPSVADRSRSGDIDFEDLSRPHRPLALSIACDALPPGDSDARAPSAAAAAALIPEVGRLARLVSRTLALEGVEPLLVALERSSGLSAWLAALGGVAQASGRSIELVIPAPVPQGASRGIGSTLAALAGLEPVHGRGALPRLVVDAAALARVPAPARADAERLLATGLLLPSWSAEGERCAGSALVRTSRERGAIACGAAVVLNLPRIARRAGAWRVDALFQAAADQIETAIEGLLALRDFQRESRDRAAPRARTLFALSPAGLREALSILGDGDLREDQAARVLSFLAEAAERLGRQRGLELSLVPAFQERAAERFARLDGLEFRVRQPWLFAGPDALDTRSERAYSGAFEIAAEVPLCAALGALPTGALHSPSVLSALAASRPEIRELPLLHAWERLERGRGRTRGGAHAIYALPPIFSASGTSEEESTSDLFAPTLTAPPLDP